MQYHVYLTTNRLENPNREVSKYFESGEDAERYYCELVNGGKFDRRPLVLVLEKIDVKNILKRHDFSCAH